MNANCARAKRLDLTRHKRDDQSTSKLVPVSRHDRRPPSVIIEIFNVPENKGSFRFMGDPPDDYTREFKEDQKAQENSLRERLEQECLDSIEW